jgi:hypothetical protein
MLQVKTYIDKSPIQGIGLFAAEDIPKGTITWEYYPDLDIALEKEGFGVGRIEWEFIEKYAFYDKQLNKWILSADNDRFTNHSENPNTGPLKDGRMQALKDIKQGEEITSNYYEIDFDVNTKLVNTRDN